MDPQQPDSTQNTTPPEDNQSPPTAQPAAPAEAALQPVPDTWPGFMGAYKYSKEAVKFNLGTVVILFLISTFAGIIPGLFDQNAGNLISFVVTPFVSAASAYVFISGVRRKKVELGEASSVGFRFYLKMLGLTILIGLSLMLSLLALIIPFFFVLPRLLLANNFLVDKDQGVIEAYKSSWNATKGHALNIWGIIFLNAAMSLLFITIIGIPVAIYLLIMYSAAFALLYVYLEQKSPVTAADPAPAAAPETNPAPPETPTAPTV
jgi:hypothetical protein